jgi:hypothetical protein
MSVYSGCLREKHCFLLQTACLLSGILLPSLVPVMLLELGMSLYQKLTIMGRQNNHRCMAEPMTFQPHSRSLATLSANKLQIILDYKIGI